MTSAASGGYERALRANAGRERPGARRGPRMLYSRSMGLLPLLRAGRKVAVSGYIAFHLASVLWWNIPLHGYPADTRRAPLPEWAWRAGEALGEWKRRVGPQSRIVHWLEGYTRASATWQQWWMFAPNPLGVHRYIRVQAVLGETPEGRPIYDPEPLYTSYRGSLDEELRRFSTLGGALAPYTHDHKFVENLSLGEFDHCLDPFARHFGRVYERKTGRRPVAIHVICTEFPLPEPFSGTRAWEVRPREWILWWARL